MNKFLDKFLDKLFNEASWIKKKRVVTARQANRTQDIKADRLPTDKHAHLSKTNNHINKLMHQVKTKGNSISTQRKINKAKIKRFKQQQKLNS